MIKDLDNRVWYLDYVQKIDGFNKGGNMIWQVILLACVQLSRARIKLNAKRLYSADGYAVKELLKIATVLQLATRCAIVSEVN